MGPGRVTACMHKLLQILIVTAGLFLIACRATDPLSELERDVQGSMRVMTFNIRYGTASDGPNHWGLRRENVITTIRDQSPELVGIQEALDFQVEFLAERFPNFEIVGTGREGGMKGEFSCLLIDRERFDVRRSGTFWLSDEPETVGSKGWDAALPRICTWAVLLDRMNGREFVWMNTHFDHRGQLAREQSGQLIHSRLADFPGLPAIVTGDLNAAEESEPLVALKGDALRDSFREIHPSAGPAGTFNFFRGHNEGDKIDYVLCSEHWSVLSASIDRRQFDGRNPSDHYPVLADLRLRARGR